MLSQELQDLLARNKLQFSQPFLPFLCETLLYLIVFHLPGLPSWGVGLLCGSTMGIYTLWQAYCPFSCNVSGPLSSLHLPLHSGTVASSKVILPLKQQARIKPLFHVTKHSIEMNILIGLGWCFASTVFSLLCWLWLLLCLLTTLIIF